MLSPAIPHNIHDEQQRHNKVTSSRHNPCGVAREFRFHSKIPKVIKEAHSREKGGDIEYNAKHYPVNVLRYPTSKCCRCLRARAKVGE